MEVTHIIIGVILAVILVAGGIYVNGFKNWLVWAVSEAENVFGSNTGKLKLRYAYELALERYPVLGKIIPFAVFSEMVDGALVIMRKMIEDNADIAAAIND